MQLNLLGVWDDGTPFGALVPTNARTALAMYQGADVAIVMNVVDNAGQVLNIDNDIAAVALLSVKVQSGLQRSVISVVGTQASPNVRGQRIFTLPAAATKLAKLPNGPGRYVYDVWLTYFGQRGILVPLSPFTILPAAGQP